MVGTKASHCKSQVLQKRKFWFCVLVLVLKGPEDNRQQGKKNDVCRTSAPLEEMEGVPDGERWGEGVGRGLSPDQDRASMEEHQSLMESRRGQSYVSLFHQGFSPWQVR